MGVAGKSSLPFIQKNWHTGKYQFFNCPYTSSGTCATAGRTIALIRRLFRCQGATYVCWLPSRLVRDKLDGPVGFVVRSAEAGNRRLRSVSGRGTSALLLAQSPSTEVKSGIICQNIALRYGQGAKPYAIYSHLYRFNAGAGRC